LYSFFGSECFSHLAKVAAGFDSVIFGEAEIQRQIKKAYEQAALCQSFLVYALYVSKSPAYWEK
jgi:glutamyl-tRNA reductase